MIRFFRTDPAVAVQAAQTAITETESRILRLEAERTAKLGEPEGVDYVDAVGKIDREIAGLRVTLGVHRDRLAVLEVRAIEERHARRLQQKATNIAEIKKTLPRRQAAAEQLNAALSQLVSAYTAFVAAEEETFAGWSEWLPPARSLSYLRAGSHDLLSSRRSHHPMQAGLICEVATRDLPDFAAEVRKLNGELIAELEGSPILETHMEAAA